MPAIPAAILLLAVLLAAPRAWAQATAECASIDCLGGASPAGPADRQLWAAAASVHELKLRFVEMLQRFLRAQAGTFGDEGPVLVESLASMHAALAQWDAGIRRFQADVDRRVPSPDVHVALATVLLDRQRGDDALDELDAADRLDPNRSDVHRLRALAFGMMGRPADAARALRVAASLHPDDPTVLYALAREASRPDGGGGAAEALAALRRTLTRRAAPARQGPGAARFERVDLLRQPAGVAPIFPLGRYTDGFSALEKGDYAAALARFQEALAGETLLAGGATPNDRAALAADALRQGQVRSAIELLQAAVAAAPDSESHRLLGVAYWVDDQPGRSLEHLRTAIRLAPADERARIMLADVLLAAGRGAEAERELTQAIEAGVRSGSVHYRLAQLYRRQSLLPQAEAALQASHAFGPVVGRDRFYQLLGSIRVDRADFDGAVAAYAQRVEVNPNSGEAHRQLGEIEFLQGRHEEALAEFLVAAWLDPGDARAHAGVGQAYVRLSKYGDAVPALRRALAIDPTLREARYALGTSLMRAGSVDEGRRELEAFREQQAEAEAAGQREFQIDALRREASRQLNAGATGQAIVLFEQILAVDALSARSHRDLGLALLRAQRPVEAIRHLESAQRVEETPEGFRHLADAFNAAGDRDAAARQVLVYRAALEDAKRRRIRELAGAQ